MLYVAILLLTGLVMYFLFAGKYHWYLISSFLYIQFAPPLVVGKFVLTWTGMIILGFGFVHFLIEFIRDKTKFQKNVKMRAFCISMIIFMVVGLLNAIYLQSHFLLLGTPLLEIFLMLAVIYYSYIIDSKPNLDLEYVLKQFIIWSLVLNFIAVMLQRVAPAWMTKFMLQYYAGNATLYVRILEQSNTYYRASGWSIDPVVLGAEVCTVIFFMLPFIKSKYRGVLYLITAIMGLLALSKTFVLAAVIGCFFYVSRYYKQLKTSLRVFLVFAVLLACFVAVGIFSPKTIQAYTPRKLQEMFSLVAIVNNAAAERYNTSLTTSSQIVNTQQFIAHPLFGAGYSDIKGSLLGDTSYNTLLFLNGIFGICVLFIAYAVIYFSSPMGSLPRVTLFAVCLAGFALKTYDDFFFAPYFVFIIALKADNLWVKNG
jgi:hypothetical protein